MASPTSWRYSVGNCARRAAVAPAAVSPAVADADLVLANLCDDYPDTLGALQWRADGAYAIDFDLNQLLATSSRADAPTGWLDLLNVLAGTPGLPTNAPDWGTYGSRTALRLYRPVLQELGVMPGEDVKLQIGIRWPAAASGATGIRVRVVDTATGLGWNGSAWAAGGVLDSQLVADTWKDIDETITASATATERTTYQVIVEPIAASFGATTYCYASAYGASGSPAFFPEVDLVAIVGHNLTGATVALVPQGGGTTLTLTPAQPSMYVVGAAAQLVRIWRLTIQMPAGNAPRPEIGEVWIGQVQTLLAEAPVLPIGKDESSPGQIRVTGARGRLEIVGEDARPVADLELKFIVGTEARYRQIRDGISRLTRFGAEPLLLLPGLGLAEGTEPCYHGRLEDRVSYSLILPRSGTKEGAHEFSMPFAESPFAATG